MAGGQFEDDFDATWPQLIICDEDQKIWDGQLGPSVAIRFEFCIFGQIETLLALMDCFSCGDNA